MSYIYICLFIIILFSFYTLSCVQGQQDETIRDMDWSEGCAKGCAKSCKEVDLYSSFVNKRFIKSMYVQE